MQCCKFQLGSAKALNFRAPKSAALAACRLPEDFTQGVQNSCERAWLLRGVGANFLAGATAKAFFPDDPPPVATTHLPLAAVLCHPYQRPS